MASAGGYNPKASRAIRVLTIFRFLALPAVTPPKIALDVFVKMNTSFVKLSSFDIAVAFMEAIAGVPLHDQLADLEKNNPAILRFRLVEDLILDTAAYRCGLNPTATAYKKVNWQKIADEWEVLAAGIAGVLEILDQERIYDERRLPSYPPLPVIAALWEFRGQADAEGRARELFRRYLWHAFLTDRYHRSTGTNAPADFRSLRDVLQGKVDITTVPAFNSADHPIANVETIAAAGWPKEKNILGRALLTLELQCNALDFADASPATADNVRRREYHHLFPAATLEKAGLSDDQIWRAVNCALITWKTNRKLSDLDPLVYLQKRTEHALNGEDEIRSRLCTHLVYFPHLQVGPYAALGDGERKQQVTEDYARFCQSRAQLLHAAAVHVAAGKLLTADAIPAALGTRCRSNRKCASCMTHVKVRKNLIEVALPLEAINKAAAREKSIRHGHPSTLHLWWARRPLAAARAVIFAQMVDDPSSYVDELKDVPHLRRKAESVLRSRHKRWEEATALAEKAKAAGIAAPEPGPEPKLDDILAEAARNDLFKIIEDLVLWENTTNEDGSAKGA